MNNPLTVVGSTPEQNDKIDPFRLAESLAQSGYFQDAREVSQALVKLVAGRELGIGDIAAMTGIFLIQGRVTLSANLMAALVKRSGRYDYTVETLTDDLASIVFSERSLDGASRTLGKSTFSAADAAKAGTQNMSKFARNMLFARAMSNGFRWYTPDLAGGGPVYTPEELGEAVDEDGSPVAVEAAVAVEQATPPPRQDRSGQATQDQQEAFGEALVWAVGVGLMSQEKSEELRSWAESQKDGPLGIEIRSWRGKQEIFGEIESSVDGLKTLKGSLTDMESVTAREDFRRTMDGELEPAEFRGLVNGLTRQVSARTAEEAQEEYPADEPRNQAQGVGNLNAAISQVIDEGKVEFAAPQIDQRIQTLWDILAEADPEHPATAEFLAEFNAVGTTTKSLTVARMEVRASAAQYDADAFTASARGFDYAKTPNCAWVVGIERMAKSAGVELS